jgi:acyl-CoA thioester hydrolase
LPSTFNHRLRVRYNECDPQGVVFNAEYFVYFDVILTEFLRETIGPHGSTSRSGIDLVVAAVGARYLEAAGFDDQLDLKLEVARLGTTSLATRIVVKHGSRTVAEGEMRHVFVDPATGSKRPIPQAVRSALEPFVADSACC